MREIPNGAPASDASRYGAAEILQAVRGGAISAESLVDALLRRYERTKHLNLFAWIEPDRAREQARAVDRARGEGKPLPPLAGLPLLVKDNIDTIGFPTSAGTAALKSYHPKADAPVWRALAQQGAILLGKTNMHELAAGGTSSNPVFGSVRNPHAPDRIPGGSSGGTAAAIAAGIAPAGLGTDTVGSVRGPAAFCGVVSLRPTTARHKLYSAEGVVTLIKLFDTIGPMGRTAGDVALLHSAVTGTPQAMPTGLKGVRIGLPRNPLWRDLDVEVAGICEEALRCLEAAGAVVVDVDLSALAPSVIDAHVALTRIGRLRDLDAFLKDYATGITLDQVTAQIASRDVRALYEARALPLESENDLVTQVLPRLLASYTEMFRRDGLAALVFPTVPVPAPEIRAAGDAPDDRIMLNGVSVPVAAMARNVRLASGLGVPAVNIPIGMTKDRLPVGMEIAGLPDEDHAVLGLGLAVEDAVGLVAAPRL